MSRPSSSRVPLQRYDCPYCSYSETEKILTVDHIIACLSLERKELIQGVQSLQHFLILQCCFNQLIQDCAGENTVFQPQLTSPSEEEEEEDSKVIINLENVKLVQDVFLKEFEKCDERFISGLIKVYLNEQWQESFHQAIKVNKPELVNSGFLLNTINFKFLKTTVLIFLSLATLQHFNPEFNHFLVALISYERGKDMDFTFKEGDLVVEVAKGDFLRIFAKFLNGLLSVIYVDQQQFDELKAEIDAFLLDNLTI
ncbi:hypothetical protein WICPIJ_005953 [Wickerhamomyces pijperi]|uniref:Uncharacterized protein n=1 Tax=Wickerhamomyces pijperi TaxID=599730 RepID=A0A9P8Q4Y5_WICPI|nr:hypothetical protein WICPIJ_005953 [Wickerhamomyces pijperi]